MGIIINSSTELPLEDSIIKKIAQATHLLLFLKLDDLSGKLLVKTHMVFKRTAETILNIESIIYRDI